MKIIDVPQSGNCGLTVTWPGRYGLTRRGWVVPANPRTVGQLNVRSALTQSAQAFRGLTQAQQDAWNAAAAGVQSKTRLGQSGPLTGNQLYVKINASLTLTGQPTVADPPPKAQFAALVPTGLVATVKDGVLTLSLTCPGDPGASTLLRASAPQSSGVRRLPSLRMIGMCPAPAQGIADLSASYSAKFGVPAVGQRMFVTAAVLQNGWEGPPQAFSALVTAGA